MKNLIAVVLLVAVLAVYCEAQGFGILVGPPGLYSQYGGDRGGRYDSGRGNPYGGRNDGRYDSGRGNPYGGRNDGRYNGRYDDRYDGNRGRPGPYYNRYSNTY